MWLDDPLPAALAGMLIGQLLNHTSGLFDLDAHAFLASTRRRQDAAVLASRPPMGWRVGENLAYCQIAPWQLLGQVIESLTGTPVAACIRERVLDPLGIASDVFVAGMTRDDYQANKGRLGVNLYISGLDATPILAERNARLRCIDSPAFGNTASARGLGRFYEGLLRIVRGEAGIISPDMLRQLTARQSEGFDPLMGRQCSYGYGFMIDLRGHAFGNACGERSFGHSGYGGMTAAFVDPDVDLVGAFHLNGRVDADSALVYHRPALVGAVYRELGLAQVGQR